MTVDSASAPARYSANEEIANYAIHGLGLLLAIIGLGVLLTSEPSLASSERWIGSLVFGLSLILLYGASTAYHAVNRTRIKARLRMLDHAAIFVLIAGTYTPFMLVNLNGPWGWTLLSIIWVLALVGVAVQLTRLRTRRGLRVGLCVLMGWLVVIAIDPMLERVAFDGLMLLLAGGLAYTAGIGFYVWRSLPYHHAVWHLFVLAGSALHFFAVLYFAVSWP